MDASECILHTGLWAGQWLEGQVQALLYRPPCTSAAQTALPRPHWEQDTYLGGEVPCTMHRIQGDSLPFGGDWLLGWTIRALMMKCIIYSDIGGRGRAH